MNLSAKGMQSLDNSLKIYIKNNVNFTEYI